MGKVLHQTLPCNYLASAAPPEKVPLQEIEQTLAAMSR
jgi:hypothetical protein